MVSFEAAGRRGDSGKNPTPEILHASMQQENQAGIQPSAPIEAPQGGTITITGPGKAVLDREFSDPISGTYVDAKNGDKVFSFEDRQITLKQSGTVIDFSPSEKGGNKGTTVTQTREGVSIMKTPGDTVIKLPDRSTIEEHGQIISYFDRYGGGGIKNKPTTDKDGNTTYKAAFSHSIVTCTIGPDGKVTKEDKLKIGDNLHTKKYTWTGNSETVEINYGGHSEKQIHDSLQVDRQGNEVWTGPEGYQFTRKADNILEAKLGGITRTFSAGVLTVQNDRSGEMTIYNVADLKQDQIATYGGGAEAELHFPDGTVIAYATVNGDVSKWDKQKDISISITDGKNRHNIYTRPDSRRFGYVFENSPGFHPHKEFDFHKPLYEHDPSIRRNRRRSA